MLYTPGHDFFLQWADEPTFIVETAGEPTLQAQAVSGSRFPIGHINPSDIVKDDGDDKGYAAGSRFALYDREKGHTYDMTIPIRVVSLAADGFLRRCIASGGSGTKRYDLPQSQLFYGSGTSGRAFRHAVCNTLAVSIEEGSGSELQATATMMAIYDEAATLVVPSYSDMRALGSPATWHDFTAFTIGGAASSGGDNYRQMLGGINWTENHNLERKGFRPHYVGAGSLAATLTTWDLLPHHIEGEGEIRWHKEILTTSNNWGDMVLTFASNTVTLVNCRPQQRRQPGVESSAQLGWTTPFKFDYMTVA